MKQSVRSWCSSTFRWRSFGPDVAVSILLPPLLSGGGIGSPLWLIGTIAVSVKASSLYLSQFVVKTQ
jgi:hypothetical protein